MSIEKNSSEHNDDGLTAKVASLTILQGIVSRMASNSLAMKTWAITIVTGFIAIKSTLGGMGCFANLVPILICCAFSFLDAYYLSQERVFRHIYNELAKSPVGGGVNYLDFGKEIKLANQQSKNKIRACYTSLSVICFYAPLVVISTIILIKG
ncbi:hypothetical protein RA259_004253 [Cronobacter sakazakii]|nr:hypothetical protein [Cronobacter sakazakii]